MYIPTQDILDVVLVLAIIGVPLQIIYIAWDFDGDGVEDGTPIINREQIEADLKEINNNKEPDHDV